MSAHSGAHVDSSLHCLSHGSTLVEETPLEKVIGRGILFDLSHLGANAAVNAAELENADPGLQENDIALLFTGWSDRMYTTFPDYYTESPFLDLSGAQWLRARRPKAIAFDFFEEYKARFDDFTSEDFVAHRELLGNGIVLLEGAANLGALKGKGPVKFFAPFYKLAGIEGAPARFFAIVEEPA
jgi:kynurenine formamidase